MKSRFILIFIFLFFIGFVNAECFPSYQCGEWGACIDGLSTRVCVDVKCEAEDISERQFCGEDDCKPNIECGGWSNCNYFDKTNDIIKEQLIFRGVKERICNDVANCINSFVEQEGCSLSAPIKVRKTEWCGEQLVEILNEAGNVVGRVKQQEITSKLRRVDISLVEQNIPTYCSYCFDGVKNYDEAEKDCGGPSCPECIESVDFFDWAFLASFFSWGICFLLVLVGFVVFSRDERFNQGFKNLIYLFKPLSREEAMAREQKIKEFFVQKKINPEGFKNY